jgi:hypothetical protein
MTHRPDARVAAVAALLAALCARCQGDAPAGVDPTAPDDAATDDAATDDAVAVDAPPPWDLVAAIDLPAAPADRAVAPVDAPVDAPPAVDVVAPPAVDVVAPIDRPAPPDLGAPPDPCAQCTAASCASQQSLCGALPDCAAYAACRAACAPGNGLCILGCGSAHAAGARAFTALDTCAARRCGASCGRAVEGCGLADLPYLAGNTACGDCQRAQCCGQGLDCAESVACQEAAVCANACATHSASCPTIGLDACRALPGWAPEEALVACSLTRCASACVPAAPPPPRVRCASCRALDRRPTLANGDCVDNEFNCRVYPRNECDTDRVVNPYALDGGGPRCTKDFARAVGTCSTRMYDSFGNVIGVVTDRALRFNLGTLLVDRAIGLSRAMAFSVGTTTGDRSGWIDTCNVAEPLEEVVHAAMPAVPGGGVSEWHIVPCDRGTACADAFNDHTGAPLKVTATGCERDDAGAIVGGHNAYDYLGKVDAAGRPLHIVPKTYNIPGDSLGSMVNDVYPNDQGVTFHRYQSVHSVDVALYDCSRGGRRATEVLSFLYGYVVGRYATPFGQRTLARRGWMAMPNLRPGAGATP